MKHAVVWTSLALASVLLTTGTWDGCARAQTTDTNGVAIERDASLAPGPGNPDPSHLKWWREARFGMFIHWGVYSVPAGQWGDRKDYAEWIMNNAQISKAQYADIARHFDPIRYRPQVWARLARQAGMRYVVITAKHHDGFALWPSKASSWNVAQATPYQKDLLGPLVVASHANHLKIGFYYSQAQDWFNPGGAKAHYPEGTGWDPAQTGNFDAYLEQIATPQVRELVSAYPIDVLWWDTPVDMTRERAIPLAHLVAQHPNLIVNDRLGGGFKGDYTTAEQAIPLIPIAGDWEACMTINDHWGYNKSDKNFKSDEELLHDLVEIVSKGGNLLLNISPDAQGEIPVETVARLTAIGKWMTKNGSSIYGTQAGSFDYAPYGAVTQKGKRFYIHVFDWPSDGKVKVPLLNAPLKAYLLTQPRRLLTVKALVDGVVISAPRKAPDRLDSVLVLELDARPRTAPLVTASAAVSASSEDGDRSQAANLIDSDMATTWRAPLSVTSATATIRLKASRTIAGFGFSEPDVWPRLKQHYTLEAWIGDKWQPVSEGDTQGHGVRETIPALTSSAFRVTMTTTTGGPGLSELRLYPKL